MSLIQILTSCLADGASITLDMKAVGNDEVLMVVKQNLGAMPSDVSDETRRLRLALSKPIMVRAKAQAIESELKTHLEGCVVPMQKGAQLLKELNGAIDAVEASPEKPTKTKANIASANVEPVPIPTTTTPNQPLSIADELGSL